MARRFWAEDEHGVAMGAMLKDVDGPRGPPQSLVATKYALKPLQMLRRVCGRQLRLAVNQRGMNIGRAVQVRDPDASCAPLCLCTSGSAHACDCVHMQVLPANS